MTGSALGAWESDSSQFHTRRRACLANKGRVQNRLAVLVVDHDADVVHQLLDGFTGQPVEPRVCPDPAEALLLLGRTCPDVVLLGPAVGRLDPIDFLTIVRADDPDVPVVVGAGQGSGDFAARAAEVGVTAVVPRPYRTRELLAFLGSLAPKTDAVEIRPMVIDLGRLRVDGAVPQFWLDGVLVPLPPMEFLMLRYFAERPGAVVSRKELVGALWAGRPSAKSNTLNVHIMRLRKRLGDDDHNPTWIRVVRGLGYQFNVPPVASCSPDVHPV
ncbi:winged helix family two component transcriptional regulator [Lentzea atacamensis]|uniref:Winged helix family two component transcriptional regulator n=1 Tax=Lentzea atacamensis TaxID=531938 RepID=A0A316I9N8_9PSEU|nr:response regulator transcription factor [Lentzea atacamensis]PWK89520.1 winged helix family two component transcriptional regulator [Lentzea atacamensis]